MNIKRTQENANVVEKDWGNKYYVETQLLRLSAQRLYYKCRQRFISKCISIPRSYGNFDNFKT